VVGLLMIGGLVYTLLVKKGKKVQE
jgi:hypothetical protein